jgi:membrane-associated protease RseP (regulator of RpoE activity)
MDFIDFILDFILNPWFLLSLTFWLIILILIYVLRKRKEAITVFFPFIALLKTKKLNNFIVKISRKAPKLWRIFWTIGIFVSFAFTIFAIFFFFVNLVSLILNPRIENAVTPLVPGVTVGLPILAYLIIPLLFVMTTHEFAHGIAAEVDGVNVKSTGVLGAGLFYLIGLGAFVEVDERELNSSKFNKNTRLRIASAGTYVNAITAGIAFLFLINFSFLISPFYGEQVIQVDTVLTEEEGGFAYGDLSEGDVIVALKKKGKRDFVYIDGNEYKSSLSHYLNNDSRKIKISPGDELTLKIYRPRIDKYVEKDIKVGPRYKLGILYEYISNDKLQITYIFSKEEDGNNYNRHLERNLIITKINGTYINQNKGKTLEKILTKFNLTKLKLTSESGKNYYLDLDLDGVFIGIYSKLYWMPKNNIAKLLGGDAPEFLLREILWLWIIAFSITLFNMLPLPIFDGFRVVKELVNWGIGEDYKTKRKKKEKLMFKRKENNYGLSEYRVENVETVKIIMGSKSPYTERSEIIVNKNNYELIDKIGDGYKSTISFNFPENTNLKDNSLIEVTYEYWYDEKKKIKKTILYIISLIILIIIAGNFILSYIKLGSVTFWI